MPQDAPVRGIALKLASTFSFACMFALLRAVRELPAGELMFLRAAFSLGFLMLWTVRHGGLGQLRRVNRKWVLALASFVGALSMLSNLIALAHLPLVIFTTLTFLAPLFAVLIAGIALKERVGLHRLAGLAIGFTGSLVVVSHGAIGRIGDSLFSPGAGLAIVGAFLAGVIFVLLRRMAASEDASTVSFYFVLASMVGGALSLFVDFRMPSPVQWAAIAGAGFFGATSQLLMSLCYRYAEPSLLAPYEYAGIIWATLFGLILFGEMPGMPAWVGISLVVAAGLIVVWGDVPKRRTTVAPELTP